MPSAPSGLAGWGFQSIRHRKINSALYDGVPLHYFDIQEDFHRLAADEFPEPRTWPGMWQRLFFNAHKSRSDRYRLFVFLFLNGMMPHHAVYWTMWHATYDQSAWLSILDAANDTLTKDGLDRLYRNRVFNIHTGTVM